MLEVNKNLNTNQIFKGKEFKRSPVIITDTKKSACKTVFLNCHRP